MQTTRELRRYYSKIMRKTTLVASNRTKTTSKKMI